MKPDEARDWAIVVAAVRPIVRKLDDPEAAVDDVWLRLRRKYPSKKTIEGGDAGLRALSRAFAQNIVREQKKKKVRRARAETRVAKPRGDLEALRRLASSRFEKRFGRGWSDREDAHRLSNLKAYVERRARAESEAREIFDRCESFFRAHADGLGDGLTGALVARLRPWGVDGPNGQVLFPHRFVAAGGRRDAWRAPFVELVEGIYPTEKLAAQDCATVAALAGFVTPTRGETAAETLRREAAAFRPIVRKIGT